MLYVKPLKKHDQVTAFYLYKKKFEKQEAQKWWIVNSLKYFKTKLNNFNINLEIINVDSYKLFFDKLIKNKNFSIYWNKTYEPDYLKFDNYLHECFVNKNIQCKVFKGNILNEIDEIKKGDGTPFKVFTPYWRYAEKFYLEKIPPKEKKLKLVKIKLIFLKTPLDLSKFYQIKIGLKNLINYGLQLRRML